MTFTLQDAQRKKLRLEAKLDRIEGLIAEKFSAKKLKRFDKITNRLEENQEKLEFLETQRDEVSYEVFKKDGVTGVNVVITDNIFDETYTTSNRIDFKLVGTKDVGNGTRGFGTTYGLTYSEPTDAFFVAGSGLDSYLDGSYDVTANLIQNGQPIFIETLI